MVKERKRIKKVEYYFKHVLISVFIFVCAFNGNRVEEFKKRIGFIWKKGEACLSKAPGKSLVFFHPILHCFLGFVMFIWGERACGAGKLFHFVVYNFVKVPD